MSKRPTPAKPRAARGASRRAGRVAVVTGAGRRTGRTIALRLADEGARVVAVARRREEIDRTAAEARKRGVDAIAVPVDVTVPEDAERLARAVDDAFGRADFLVNAAGVYLPGAFESYPLASWQASLDTYLTGPFLLTRALLPLLRRGERGHVVNISSTLVEQGLPGFEAYCAAKAGLVGFSKCLSQSLGPLGLKVTVLTPGAINASGEAPDPATRLETADVADVIAYLFNLPPHVHLQELSIRTVR